MEKEKEQASLARMSGTENGAGAFRFVEDFSNFPAFC